MGVTPSEPGLGSAEAPEPSGLGPAGAIPNAGYVTPPWERMWFDPECAEDGCQSLVWKASYEAAVQGRQDFRNAYRDALARVKLLLTALHMIEGLGRDGEHSGDRHAMCRDIARKAILKEREAQ